MQTITMSSIQEQMPILYKARLTTTLIGIPGIGKTQIIKQKSEELLGQETENKKYMENHPELKAVPGFFHIDMSQVPEEGLAIPYVDKEAKDGQHLKYDIHPELKALKNFLEDDADVTAIFFIDEFTSASQDDQRTLMNFVEGGLLPDGEKIENNRVWFLLAGNPSSDMPGYAEYDGATNPIEEAVITRSSTFFVDADLDGFLEWGVQGNEKGRANIHPYLTAVLNNNRQLFLNKAEDDVRVLNSRTAEKLSNYFYTAEEMGAKWQAMVIKSLAGDAIGADIASQISKLDKLVGLKELFGDEKSEDLDKKALSKFKDLASFEKYYILLSAVDDASPINFKKKNSVIKMKKLLEDGDLQAETQLAFGKRIADAAAGTNAAALTVPSLVKEESTNILSYLKMVKSTTNLIGQA